jgi:hypothetical protein
VAPLIPEPAQEIGFRTTNRRHQWCLEAYRRRLTPTASHVRDNKAGLWVRLIGEIMASVDHDNFVGSFTCFFDHGLLLVEDVESRSAHAGWNADEEFVHFDVDSLYVAVQSLVDGPVSVDAYRGSAPDTEVDGMVQAFSGPFESGSGELILHDSDDKIALRVRVRRGQNRLTVLVDEVNWSARVIVVIESLT